MNPELHEEHTFKTEWLAILQAQSLAHATMQSSAQVSVYTWLLIDTTPTAARYLTWKIPACTHTTARLKSNSWFL